MIPSLAPPAAVSCGLLAHAAVRLTVEATNALRRAPVRGFGDAFTVSSLKHLDDQTLAVLSALKLALGDVPDPTTSPFRDWGVLAAPRYLGRALMKPSVARFHEEGAWGVSPHLVPHHSLHSLSGTVSQFLKARGPNFGVGGGHGSEAELLAAAPALLVSLRLPGLWLVFSRVEPELPPGEGGRPNAAASCEAVALALTRANAGAPARLEVAAGAETNDPALDFDALAGLGEKLAREAIVTLALPPIGRLTLRRLSSSLNGSPLSFFQPRHLAAG